MKIHYTNCSASEIQIQSSEVFGEQNYHIKFTPHKIPFSHLSGLESSKLRGKKMKVKMFLCCLQLIFLLNSLLVFYGIIGSPVIIAQSYVFCFRSKIDDFCIVLVIWNATPNYNIGLMENSDSNYEM
jgi:hypothetical protein